MRYSMNDWQEIRVSSKILGHISAGIYRSPAGALKELISNAYDADATRVTITTNWPSFEIITCRDNGNGILQEKFRQIMIKEIGESTKRVSTNGNTGNVTDQGRPIIGWLGIGMLGIAQICHEFKVISHHRKSQTAFSASVRLTNFPREKVDNISRDNIVGQSPDVGEFKIEPIDYDSRKAGTHVIASDMRTVFVKKFQETSGKYPLPSRFQDFLKQIHQFRSVKSISDYWQMVWELTVTCPIPYIDEGPFDWENITVERELKKQIIDLQQSLCRNQFEVVVDGLSLRKPNRYPLARPEVEKRDQTAGKVFPVSENVKVHGRPLKLSGYLYLQYNSAVEPMEIRGLLVRIRNIAIGTYDPTLFAYPSVPSPRFNWLSGEIYVNAGLESALNIDRDSFNEMDPHYLKLRSIIHTLLEEKVFPEAGRAQRSRSQRAQEDRHSKKQASVQSLIHKELGDNYTLTSTIEKPLPLTIDTKTKMIFKNDKSALLPKSKSKRDLIQRIAHAFEVSMLVPEEERREKFYQLLSEFAKLDLL